MGASPHSGIRLFAEDIARPSQHEMAALCFSGMNASEIATESAPTPAGGSKLAIRGVGYDPASITWTAIVPVAAFNGAVQIAAEFQVTRADGAVIAGEADDYLFIDAAGEMLPIPKRIALLLVRAASPHEVKTS